MARFFSFQFKYEGSSTDDWNKSLKTISLLISSPIYSWLCIAVLRLVSFKKNNNQTEYETRSPNWSKRKKKD